ncbi:VOC family protein [Chloroflexota bacterium]
MFTKIDHVELIPMNFERSIKFYTDVLGFKLTWRVKPKNSKWTEIVFLELGGSQIEIKKIKNPVAPDSTMRVGVPRFALLADDLDETLTILKAKGVIPVGQVRIAIGPGDSKLKLAEIKDPDGLSIELMERS